MPTLKLGGCFGLVLALISMPSQAAEPVGAVATPGTINGVGAEATRQARLEAAQNALAIATLDLSAVGPEEAATYGGYIESARLSLHQAAAGVADVLASEESVATEAPVPIDPASVSPMPQVARDVPRTPLVEAVTAMNDAVAAMVRDPADGGFTPIPGIFAAASRQILADLGRAGAEISLGVDYHNQSAEAEARSMVPAPSLMPTVIASTALSLGLMLGGLYFISKRKW